MKRRQVISHPKCCTLQQWELWQEAASQSKTGHHDFCTDCTPEYQAEMIAEGRCGHPKVKFRLDIDGMIEGYLPKKERRNSATTKEPTTTSIDSSGQSV